MAFEAHVPHLYFEDGNIVLSAQDSENRTKYFRVHRGVLAKHSPVFAGMFTVPLPSTVDEYDGVPVVSMAGDDADELEAFLSLLYNPEKISQILEQWEFTRSMLSPCKLAKKYLVDWIRKMAASQLEKSWPTSAKGWLSLMGAEEEIGVYSSLDPSEHWEPWWDDPTLQPREFPDSTSSILLARECDAACILPLAFLRLLQLHSHTLYASRFPLSPDDSHRLLVARERIGQWLSKKSNSAWALTVCVSPQPCQMALFRTWSLVTDTALREGHVLRSGLFNGYNSAVEAMCFEYKMKVKQMVDKLQNSFVDNLDFFFQLDE